jgi:hypothetical protein
MDSPYSFLFDRIGRAPLDISREWIHLASEYRFISPIQACFLGAGCHSVFQLKLSKNLN